MWTRKWTIWLLFPFYFTTASQTCSPSIPHVKGKTLINGLIDDNPDLPSKDVYGCCYSPDGSTSKSPQFERRVIGTIPQFDDVKTLQVLEVAKEAWNGGMGIWPQMTLKERIEKIEQFIGELKKGREDIVNILMWEIGKTLKDAESEFDRTVSFVEQTIAVIRDPSNHEFNSEWDVLGKVRAFTRRAAIGIIMCLGPYNYPLNETYATLIPALLMGNIVIMKIPTIGGLAHIQSMEAFAKTLPPGTINLISGSGRATMPPIMATGAIDGLAFIGGSTAADSLIRDHPEPHRLKVFLQLEAKNMAIYLPDIVKTENASRLDHAISETVLGALSYNGQRCTALKIIFVPKSGSEAILERLKAQMESLKVGLPWESGTQITPLPNEKRISYMKELIADAVSLGANILNENGGETIGGENSTLMVPALIYPVTESMKSFHEEQFGPVVPVVEYDSLDEVLEYARSSKYGQQVSIFTAEGEDAAPMVDKFSHIFGKININSQCSRSPDTLPFSGRRSSAMGVMSVVDALREFSVPTVVSYKVGQEEVARRIGVDSSFMTSLS